MAGPDQVTNGSSPAHADEENGAVLVNGGSDERTPLLKTPGGDGDQQGASAPGEGAGVNSQEEETTVLAEEVPLSS